MSVTQKRNSAIDLIRLIICPFVVFIHCTFPGELGRFVVNLGRFGVPYFLLLSGWFSYASDSTRMLEKSKKKLRDTLKLLGSFAIAYLIMNSLQCILSGKFPLAWILSYLNHGDLLNLLLFNRALFFGSTGYYVFMLLYIYLIFPIFVKKSVLNKAEFFVPVLLLTNVICGAFTNLPWFYYGNFLFTGLAFFLLGHLLHKHAAKLPKSNLFWIGILIFGTASSFAEAYLNRDAYCFFGTIFMSSALLILSMNSTWSVKNPARFSHMRQCSVTIFIIHCGIRDLLKLWMFKNRISCPDFLFPLLVLALCIVISALLEWLKSRKKEVAS